MKKVLLPLLIVLITAAIAAAVALAIGQGGSQYAGYPVVLLCAIFAFGVQWIVFIPSYLFQTEHYYDLTGSLTYVVTIVAALLLGTSAEIDGFDARSLLITVLVVIWAARLGPFLFARIQRAGKDGRFDKIKVFWPRFLVTWTLQGMWVFLTLAAALAAMTTTEPRELELFAVLGTLVWIIGFAIEVVADAQKSAFNNNPDNAGRFINTGLWRWSRHPNYFGEIVLWVGITIIALPTLQGWGYVALISPVFVTLLLTRISGVPLLEQRADEKWGGEADYEAYKAATSVLVPLPPKQG